MKIVSTIAVGLMVVLSILALGSIALPLLADPQSGRFQPLPLINASPTPAHSQNIADLATATPTPQPGNAEPTATPTNTPVPMQPSEARAQLYNLVNDLNDVLNNSTAKAYNVGLQGPSGADSQAYNDFLTSVDTDLHNRMRLAQKIESNNPTRYDPATNAVQDALDSILIFDHGILRDWIANKANNAQYNAAISAIKDKITAAQTAIAAI